MKLTTAKLREQFLGGTVNWIIRRQNGHDQWFRGPVTDIRVARNKPDRKLWLDISLGSMESQHGPDHWVAVPSVPMGALGKDQFFILAPLAELVEMKARPG